MLLGLLAVGNFVALGILVAGLVTASTSDLSGGELLLTGFAIYTSDVVVFGLDLLGGRGRGAGRSASVRTNAVRSSFASRRTTTATVAGSRRSGTTSTSP